MALTTTSLAAAVGPNDTVIRVTSATGFGPQQTIRVDNETMAQSAAAVGTVVPVRRGLDGSAQVAHGTAAAVTTGLGSDFPSPPPGSASVITPGVTPGRVTISATSLTINTADLPTQDTTYVLAAPTAAAITLSAPSAAQDGRRLTFRSNTAAAHTVTYAAGFYGDGATSNIATFAAKIGSSITIEAQSGAWGVLALANVTLA